MDSRDEITLPGGATAAPDLAAVEQLYERIAREGVVAGIEYLLGFCHDDVELRAYAAQAVASPTGERIESLRGRDEILSFFRDRTESGFAFRISARSFEVHDDTVVARGSIRVARPDGSFAETQVSWNYRFRGGLVDAIGWEPRAGG